MGRPLNILEKPDDSIAVAALAAAQDGIWDLDFYSGRLYLSDQCKALLGYGPTELTDDPEEWFARIHQDDLPSVQLLLNKNKKRVTAHFRSQHRIKNADGKYRWFLARGGVVRKNGKFPGRIAGTLTDINDLKHHELQMMQQLDELRFALASEKVLMDELDRKNQELTELSITDGLTKLFNHRYLQDRFDYEFKRVRRYGGMLSCIIIDIDHFKVLNDTYGHQYGDYVIKQVATLIKARSREVDICGRYGGEEFMVITNLHEKNALLYATKLHDAIQNFHFEHPSAEVKVTVSVGVAEYDNELKTKQELIERADRAMYQAKKNGRNLVCLWRETVDSDQLPVNAATIEAVRERLRGISLHLYSDAVRATESLIVEMEQRYPLMAGHSVNVSRYATAIAEKMNMPAEMVETVRLGAFLHDIGKICIEDNYARRSTLSDEKREEIIKRHPDIGATLLIDIGFLDREIPVVLYHHERFNGKGYPHRLKGREIPIEARIVAAADAFDNYVSGRHTGRKKSERQAVELMRRSSGKHYCPEIVDVIDVDIAKSITPIQNSSRKEKEGHK